MQPKLTKPKIINLARKHISLPPISASQQASVEDMYELIKSSMLNERPWPFTVALARTVQTTTQGEDLGYAYKYRIPTDAIGVIALNPSARTRLSAAASNYDLLRVGLTPGDDQPLADVRQNQDYHLKDGILHTFVPVNDLLYKRDAAEKEFTPDFLLSLSWQLAKYFALNQRGTAQYAQYCQQEADMYHARAYRGIAGNFPSIERKQFLSFLRQFYGSLYL